MEKKSENKSLFLTIIVVFSVLAGLNNWFITFLGAHTGAIVVAVITLLYQGFVLAWKQFYDTGKWMHGWAWWFKVANILTFLIMAINLFVPWSSTVGLGLNENFVFVLNRIVVGSNLAILLLNTDWKKLISSFTMPDEFEIPK